MKSLKSGQSQIDAVLPVSYRLRDLGPQSDLYIILHGYSQSAEIIIDELQDVLPEDVSVLVPNATFPVPIRRDSGGYGVAYSWYFYDIQNKVYHVDVNVPRDHVRQLVEQLGFLQRPTTVIGYSQGGYLAPHVASVLPHAKRVIGLAAQFIVSKMNFPVQFRMDAIHGDQDDYVEYARAKRFFDELRSRGVEGEFYLLAGVGHKLDPKMLSQLREVLEDS